MAGIVHYSNFFRFMEAAEHAFFRSLGFSVAPRPGATQVGWPRVHASCDYLLPLRFEDLVEIWLLVVEKRSKAITYEFRFQRLNVQPPQQVARGRLTVVCIARQPDGGLKATTIPDEIAARIEVAPAELLRKQADKGG